MEGGKWQETASGTPQGGPISVLLANVYLHYVLDIWFSKTVRPRMKGEAYLVRYLDDFVVCFEYKSDATRFERALRLRLEKFSLELESSKTRLIPFGKFAQRDAKTRGMRKPPVISFLGFDLYGFRYTWGWFGIGLKPQGSRTCRFLNKLKEVMRKNRHFPLKHQWRTINLMWRGWVNYFGLPLNSRRISAIHNFIVRYWRKVLSTRSQRGRLNWTRFKKILQIYPIAHCGLKYDHKAWRTLSIEQAKI